LTEYLETEPELVPKEKWMEERDALYTVLVVEDNEELLQILDALFSPVYRVVLARNERGTGKAQERNAGPHRKRYHDARNVG
jgi:hypothetical protein